MSVSYIGFVKAGLISILVHVTDSDYAARQYRSPRFEESAIVESLQKLTMSSLPLDCPVVRTLARFFCSYGAHDV